MRGKKRCCFAGHREIQGSGAEKAIERIAEELIVRQGVNEFWVGNYGNFDRIAGASIRKLKKTYADIELNLIVPYLTKDMTADKEWYSQKFDNILLADIPCSAPKRVHILKTNEFMVNHSDFLICCISHSWGGASLTFEYAKRKGLTIFNIASEGQG